MKYRRQLVISGKGGGRGEFAEALRGLTIDAKDRVLAVGDSKVCVFSSAGELLASWRTARPGYSVAVNVSGEVYVGEPGQVEVLDPNGKLLKTWADAERMGLVTAIGFAKGSILVADARGRCIRRYDRQGGFLRDIGRDNRMKGFVLPNAYLDFAVDGKGVIHASNPGKHRVERYSLEGELLGWFGRFGGVSDPAGFSGCCNPTNVVLTRGGQVVVTTKAEPMAKVYDPEGKLLAVLGEKDFDPNCKNMDVAVDSRGRIYCVDTARLHICVFASDQPQPKEKKPTSEAATP